MATTNKDQYPLAPPEEIIAAFRNLDYDPDVIIITDRASGEIVVFAYPQATPPGQLEHDGPDVDDFLRMEQFTEVDAAKKRKCRRVCNRYGCFWVCS